jgi:hypothetical protein
MVITFCRHLSREAFLKKRNELFLYIVTVFKYASQNKNKVSLINVETYLAQVGPGVDFMNQ